uniref:Putative ovule protein n=1 Tax=Solanum chacoense TaxID=4108 RepID=A0A0V0GFL0_SOLCH
MKARIEKGHIRINHDIKRKSTNPNGKIHFLRKHLVGKFPFCYYFANPMYETCERDSDDGPEPLCDNTVTNF